MSDVALTKKDGGGYILRIGATDVEISEEQFEAIYSVLFSEHFAREHEKYERLTKT